MPKINFNAGSRQEVVKVANGRYFRSFKREEQPFDVTDEEWRILRREGEFELVKETQEESHEESHEDSGEESHEEAELQETEARNEELEDVSGA